MPRPILLAMSGASSLRQTWSSAEEALLLDAVNELVMKQLWAKVKDEPAMAARMNGGVMGHWKAMVSAASGEAASSSTRTSRVYLEPGGSPRRRMGERVGRSADGSIASLSRSTSRSE